MAQIDEQTAEATRTAATIEQEAEALRKLAEEATRIQQLTETGRAITGTSLQQSI